MFGRELHVRSRVQNTAAPDFTEHHQATQNPSILNFVYSIFFSFYRILYSLASAVSYSVKVA